MTIKRILKILGYIFLPLLPMAIAIYFLFPYLNEEKYKRVAEKHDGSGSVVADSIGTLSPDDYAEIAAVGEDFAMVKKQAKEFQQHIRELRSDIDSVNTVNDSLRKVLASKVDEIEKLENSRNQEVGAENAALVADTDTEFSEKIKSLLDLDVEKLTPILSKMDDKQLVRIFRAGSGLQRKKLLRSLKSERAAKLMKEVL